MWWGELSSECGASCLLNGASCLLNVGRVVLGRVFFGASCLGASCLWGELSVIHINFYFIYNLFKNIYNIHLKIFTKYAYKGYIYTKRGDYGPTMH